MTAVSERPTRGLELGHPVRSFVLVLVALRAVVLPLIALVFLAPAQPYGLHRNFALAHYMRAFGNLTNPPELTLGAYFHQCAIEMSCIQLARAGRFLVGATAGPRLVSPERVRRINALMLTCGHYDGSGEFAFRVGLPGKSGVGGGILVIAPGHAAIAVWSPGLNEQGNSQLGSAAVEMLARRTGWSVFG